MARGFKALVLAVLFLIPSGAAKAYEDRQPVFVQDESAAEDVIQAVPTPEDLAREARMRELEDRFKALSNSLGRMPAPPEVKDKKITFGEPESRRSGRN